MRSFSLMFVIIVLAFSSLKAALQGNIRLIRVGSGSKNAKAIHDMIEKLLADKPVAAK